MTIYAIARCTDHTTAQDFTAISEIGQFTGINKLSFWGFFESMNHKW